MMANAPICKNKGNKEKKKDTKNCSDVYTLIHIALRW